MRLCTCTQTKSSLFSKEYGQVFLVWRVWFALLFQPLSQDLISAVSVNRPQSQWNGAVRSRIRSKCVTECIAVSDCFSRTPSVTNPVLHSLSYIHLPFSHPVSLKWGKAVPLLNQAPQHEDVWWSGSGQVHAQVALPAVPAG